MKSNLRQYADAELDSVIEQAGGVSLSRGTFGNWMKVLKIHFDSSRFQTFITVVILINSLLIGLETSDYVVEKYGHLIDAIDMIILAIFSLEMVLKMCAFRTDFYKNGWNIFDLVVISISLLPAAGSFAIFRALRIVRTLRILRSIPKLRLIMESLIQSIPSIGWIVVLLSVVFYVYAVMGVNLFATAYPEFFGNIWRALFTLFQIMTLESWSTAIARPVMDNAPFAGIYFITFILMATYTALNIFIAIVVNTMNDVSLKDIQNEEKHIKDFVASETSKLQLELLEIKEYLKIIKNENRRPDEILAQSELNEEVTSKEQ